MKRLQRQRKNSCSLRLFILIFTITLGLVVLSSVVPAYNQTPNRGTSCQQKVQELAQSDVKNDIPRRNDYPVKLYGKKCGLEDEKILQIYDYEYTKQSKANKNNLWEQLKPGTGWSVAVVLFLALIFKDTLTKSLSDGIKGVGEQIYSRLSETPLLYRYSLKRYRRELKENYEKLKISFRPKKTLNIKDIYVPLKVIGTNDSDLIDAFQAVGKYHRLMVTGSPGSGKTMLLKSIVLSYATDEWAKLFKELQYIPILVELYRFSSNRELTVEQQLVEALQRNGFPNSKYFIFEKLKNNKLLLLLDGLDEVSSSERYRVVGQINNFLKKNKKCPVIITCRTAVYRGEFNNSVEQTLEVVEFSDQQIHDFLGSWKPDMPPDKSVEQLMQTLQDRPRIMALARNPLILTIIAYLYTDTTFVLPHSRAEFYRIATDILLEQWHYERNQYKEREKKQILQHLALFFQDNANNQGQDRLSVEWKIVVSEVKSQLPYLNLSDSDVKPLLTEIVERSGLLLAIDGGERYQFASLTLQEFFAASKLREDANGLIKCFKKDPDAWREIIKLWCGIADHNTDLIREVNVVDPITAFECLADAKSVDSTLANQIINNFKLQLGTDGNEDRVNHAFASVAADEKRRKDVLTFLKETLEDTSETEARRYAAANALCFTNLPSAAEVLAKQYTVYPKVRSLLVKMGDLAVPKLEFLVQKGISDAVFELKTIGTPLAKQTLVSLAPLIDKKIEEIEIKEFENTIVERIKIEFNQRSSFFLNKKSDLSLKVYNITDKKIKNLVVQLDDTSRYNVESSEENKIKISEINAQEWVLIHYPFTMSQPGVATLQLKVNDRIYKSALEILSVEDNPYSYGSPIKDNFNFFGRETEIQEIINNTCSFEGRHSMLIGEQRSGKTSLLFQVQNILKQQVEYITIYISFSGIERDVNKALEWLLNEIVKTIKEEIDLKIDIKCLEPLHFARDFIDRLDCILDNIKRIKPQKKIVLLLDEIHIMNTINIQFQEVLREAFSKSIKDIRVVVACYYRFFEGINVSGSPFQNIFRYIHLKPFQEKDLDKLIAEPVNRLGYNYEENAIKHIKRISGGHPYYCQFLCATAFKEAKKLSKKDIVDDYVKIANDKILRDDELRFKMGYWKQLEKEEKLFLKKIIFNETNIKSKEISQRLVNIFLIQETNGHFDFTATLFRDWCQKLISEEKLICEGNL